MMAALDLGNYSIYKTILTPNSDGGYLSYNKVFLNLKKADLYWDEDRLLLKGNFLKFKRVCSNKKCTTISFNNSLVCPGCKAKKVNSRTLLKVEDRIILRDNDLRVEIPLKIVKIICLKSSQITLEVETYDNPPR